jgi:hypothetical protein
VAGAVTRRPAGATAAVLALTACIVTACDGSPGATPGTAGTGQASGGAIPTVSAASPARQPGSQVPGSVRVSAVRLGTALLSKFGAARRVAPAAGANTWAVLAPLPQNAVLAKRYGAADFPVRDPACRPWIAGLWSTALHAPRLSSTSAAAITALYGAYTTQGAHSSSVSDVSLMEISEVIAVLPSQANAVGLAAGPLPARCQQTQIWARATPTSAFTWYPGQVRQLPIPALGGGSSAVSVSVKAGVPFLNQVWSDTIRMGDYVIQVLAIMWPGIRDQVQVLQQLAVAAYGQARAALGTG